MKRTSVKSSNLAAVGYDPKKRILEVEFHNGQIYTYSPIQPEAYHDMLSAESIGQYFNTHIKGNPLVTCKRLS